MRKWKVSVGAVAAAVAAVLALASYLRPITDMVLPGYSTYFQFISGGIVVIFFLWVGIEYRASIKAVLMHPGVLPITLVILALAILMYMSIVRQYTVLMHANNHGVFPITLAILALAILMYMSISAVNAILKRERLVHIDLRVARTYNSNEKYMIAYGKTFVNSSAYDPWPVRDVHVPDQIEFSYVLIDKVGIQPGTSSGVYILFYERPINRSMFRKVVFEARVADPTCKDMDVGIRLIVEDQDSRREEVIYEMNSLKKHAGGKQRFDGTWQSFAADVRDFQTAKAPYAALPRGLSIDNINKMVFFIDDSIAKACPRNTLGLRDIRFTTG